MEYTAGTALAATYGVLALGLAVAATRESWGRQRRRLAALGMPRRDVAAIRALEVLPAAAGASLVGAAAGQATIAVLARVIDLSSITSGAQAPLRTRPALAVAWALAALVVAVAAVALESRGRDVSLQQIDGEGGS